MKRIFFILALIFNTCFVFSQTQQGIVKTRGRMVNGQLVAGQRLSGATVTLNIGNPLVSGNNGTFSFNVPSGRNYSLVTATKQGYTLADPEYTRRSFSYSAKNPFYVVLEDEAQRRADIKEATDKVRKTLKSELRKREDELDELRESNAITQARYDSLRMEFANYRQSSEALVNEMAERFAAIDYDQLDEFNRQVQQFIEEGELLKADSLINTRGSLEERYARVKEQQIANAQREEEIRQQQASLDKSRELTQREKDDLMSDLYAKHTIYLQAYQQDSALYCLKMRADLDTTNVDAVWDYAVLCDRQNDFIASLAYYKICLRYYAENNDVSNVANVQSNIGGLYYKLHDYAQCEKYYKSSLDNFEQSLDESDFTKSYFLASEQEKLGSLYIELNDFVNSEKYLKLSLENKEWWFLMNPDAFRKDMAVTQKSLGYLYYRSNDLVNSEMYYKMSLNNYEILFSQDPDANRFYLANIQVHIGNLYLSLDDTANCRKYFMQALEHYEILFNKNPDAYRSYLLNIQFNLGGLFSTLKDYANSEKYYRLALDNYVLLYNNNPEAYRSDLANCQNNLGYMYLAVKDYVNSEKYLGQALANYEQLFNKYPSVYRSYIATCQRNLGQLYWFSQDYTRSEKYFVAALENYEILYRQNPSIYLNRLAKLRWQTMNVYLGEGNMDLYDKLLHETYELYAILYESQPDNYSAYILELQNRMRYRKIEQLLMNGKLNEALGFADETYQMDSSNEYSKYYLAECCNKKAYEYLHSNDFSNAISIVDRAITLLPTFAVYFDTKGEILLMQGRNEEALAMWKKVLELNPDFLKENPDGTELSNGLKKLGLIQ